MATPSSELPPANPSAWEYSPDGQLQEAYSSTVERAIGGTAIGIIRQPGPIEDVPMAHTIALEVNRLFDADEARVASLRQEITNLEQFHNNTNNAEVKKNLETLIATRRAAQAPHSLSVLSEQRPVIDAVNREIAEREKASVEKLISARIAQDRYPWTMPNPQIPDAEVQNIRTWYELATQETEAAQDSDEFRVPFPMEGTFCKEDIKLFADIGIPIGNRWRNITRKELRDAGVFFINRVGGGEQPIFGVSIPDPESPDGHLDLRNRAFLTREEFQKVYDYQQANGYGLGDADPADVQTDMVVFAVRPSAQERNKDMRTLGNSGRDNKYGITRSPFVDSSFQVKDGALGPSVFGLNDGSRRRMNTFTIHLVNGHPDFPGVSEMFDPATTAPDQRYMSPAEYVQKLYVRPPSEEDALAALQTGLPTRREHVWVGNVVDG